MPDKPSELKPCPFCGHEAFPDGDHWEDGCDSAIQCSYCGATGGWRDSLEPESLRAERWNRRTPDRTSLVEVARRALTFADLGSYDTERLPQEIVDKYLAEQAPTPNQGGPPL